MKYIIIFTKAGREDWTLYDVYSDYRYTLERMSDLRSGNAAFVYEMHTINDHVFAALLSRAVAAQ